MQNFLKVPANAVLCLNHPSNDEVGNSMMLEEKLQSWFALYRDQVSAE